MLDDLRVAMQGRRHLHPEQPALFEVPRRRPLPVCSAQLIASRFPPVQRRDGSWLVGLPLAVSVLDAASPAAACAVTALVVTGIFYAVAQPLTIVTATALLVTTFPKAGVIVGGLPLPAMMFMLFAAIPFLRQHRRAVARPTDWFAILALAWLALRLVMMTFDGGSAADAFALVGWYGLPVLLVLVGPAVGSLAGEVAGRWTAGMELGVIAASTFAFVQFRLGIERTAVPGLTRAIGADYTRKPLQFAGGEKMPSTYQNGNVLGVVTAVFCLIAADRFLRGEHTRRDGVVLVATAAATVLSGSRTTIAGLILGLAVLVARSKVSHRTAGVAVALGLAMAAVLAFSPALSERLVGTRSNDPNLTFRTTSWAKVLRESPVRELVAGSASWVQDSPKLGQVEGALGMVQQVGLVGVGLLVAVVVAATSAPGARRWRILLIPLAISVLVDSAYLVFPTLFVPVARMFAPLESSDELVGVASD